jgi:Ulp1 family protease
MDQGIFTYKSSTLRESDIQLFDSNQWLNDQCINFFYEYLAENVGSNSVLIDPAAVFMMLLEDDIHDLRISLRRLEISDSSYIFCPINDNLDPYTPARGSHWSLCVYARGRAYYYDSTGTSATNYSNSRNIAYKLSQLLHQPTPTLTQVNLKYPQNNSSDCGVYVLMITREIVRRLEDEYNEDILLLKDMQDSISPRGAQNLRNEIKSIILSLKTKLYN